MGGGRPPWAETPQEEHGTRDTDPLEGTWDQAARQEVTSETPMWTDRQTPVKTLPCPKLRFPVAINRCRYTDPHMLMVENHISQAMSISNIHPHEKSYEFKTFIVNNHASLPHHHMLLIKELTNFSDVYIDSAPRLCVRQVIQEMA